MGSALDAEEVADVELDRVEGLGAHDVADARVEDVEVTALCVAQDPRTSRRLERDQPSAERSTVAFAE